MITLQHLAIASAILSINTGGWLRNVVLGVGAVSSGAALIELKKKQQDKGLSEEEILELSIASATLQATEMTSIHLEMVKNLKIEITSREKESLARLDAEVLAKNKTLAEIAEQDEQFLEGELHRLEAELQSDKKNFLKHHELEIARYSDRITFLEEELGAMQFLVRNYEAPILPEGCQAEQIVARRCLEILHKLDCTCDYKGSWLESGYIKVRIRPRLGGLKAVSKWLDRLMLELDLAEKPQAELVPGAIQLILKPQSLLNVERVEETETTRPMLEGVRNLLNYSYMVDFVEPEVKHSINGPITQVEVDWFNCLWNFIEPQPIRNQKAIIYRIWGKKAGDGSGYITARGRLGRIAKMLEVNLKRNEK